MFYEGLKGEVARLDGFGFIDAGFEGGGGAGLSCVELYFGFDEGDVLLDGGFQAGPVEAFLGHFADIGQVASAEGGDGQEFAAEGFSGVG